MHYLSISLYRHKTGGILKSIKLSEEIFKMASGLFAKSGLKITFIWCATMSSASTHTKRPHPNHIHGYQARLDIKKVHGETRKHLLAIGPRGGVRSPETTGWTKKEAKQRLLSMLSGNKIISIRYDSGYHETVLRIPKNITA